MKTKVLMAIAVLAFVSQQFIACEENGQTIVDESGIDVYDVGRMHNEALDQSVRTFEEIGYQADEERVAQIKMSLDAGKKYLMENYKLDDPCGNEVGEEIKATYRKYGSIGAFFTRSVEVSSIASEYLSRLESILSDTTLVSLGIDSLTILYDDVKDIKWKESDVIVPFSVSIAYSSTVFWNEYLEEKRILTNQSISGLEFKRTIQDNLERYQKEVRNADVYGGIGGLVGGGPGPGVLGAVCASGAAYALAAYDGDVPPPTIDDGPPWPEPVYNQYCWMNY